MPPTNRYLRWATRAERGIYWTVGVLLTVAAAVFLGYTVWAALGEYAAGGIGAATVNLFDRSLLALMLAQIVYTTLSFLQTGVLQVEPVLVVGIIAVVRRILVVTAVLSGTLEPGGRQMLPREQTMLELGLLALTVLILAVAVYLLRARGASPEATARAKKISRP